jgi:hypothetical protein
MRAAAAAEGVEQLLESEELEQASDHAGVIPAERGRRRESLSPSLI